MSNKEEIFKVILATDAPKELVQEVEKNKYLYPRVNKLKTLKQLNDRAKEIQETLPSVKSPSRKKRLQNELTIIHGKKITILAKQNPQIFGMQGILKGFAAEIGESSFPGKKTPQEKEEEVAAITRLTAMYYNTGKAALSLRAKT